jgi:hypothetical protein
MTILLNEQYIFLADVDNMRLVNKLLPHGWRLISLPTEKIPYYLVAFPYDMYSYIITDWQCTYPEYWGKFLDGDGKPLKEFVGFLKDNPEFADMVGVNRRNHLMKIESERKQKDFADTIKEWQEEYDLFIKCEKCSADIKVPLDTEKSVHKKCLKCNEYTYISPLYKEDWRDKIICKEKKIKKKSWWKK